MTSDLGPNVFGKHNHRQCKTNGMNEARAFCLGEGLRLTPVRERVLEILLESHKALGAYDILDRLKADGLGGQPPVVYRALEFLVEHGFVHKLERLNAFTACNHPDLGHQPMFLICRDCKQVAETPLGRLGRHIDQGAAAMGFEVQSHVVEVMGRCPTCQQTGQNA